MRDWMYDVGFYVFFAVFVVGVVALFYVVGTSTSPRERNEEDCTSLGGFYFHLEYGSDSCKKSDGTILRTYQ